MIIIKIFIVLILLSAITGAVYGALYSFDRGWENCIIWTLVAPSVLTGLIIFFLVLVKAIIFLVF